MPRFPGRCLQTVRVVLFLIWIPVIASCAAAVTGYVRVNQIGYEAGLARARLSDDYKSGKRCELSRSKILRANRRYVGVRGRDAGNLGEFQRVSHRLHLECGGHCIRFRWVERFRFFAAFSRGYSGESLRHAAGRTIFIFTKTSATVRTLFPRLCAALRGISMMRMRGLQFAYV